MRRSAGFTLIELAVVLSIVAIATAILFGIFGQGIFVRDSRVLREAAAQGYSAPRIVMRHVLFVSSWNGCSQDDDAAFEVAAADGEGRPVELLVCCSWPFGECIVAPRP